MIKAVASNAILSAILQVKKGVPLLEWKRTVLDIGNKPVEYNIGYYGGDCFTYLVDIKRMF